MHECVAGAAQQQHLRSYNLYAEKGDEWACWLPGAIVLFVILNKIHCSLLRIQHPSEPRSRIKPHPLVKLGDLQMLLHDTKFQN